MVAPNYASVRSALAKQIGLGGKPAAVPDAAPEAEPAVSRLPARRAKGAGG